MAQSRYLSICGYMSAKTGIPLNYVTEFNLFAGMAMGTVSHGLLMGYGGADNYLMPVAGFVVGTLSAVFASYVGDVVAPQKLNENNVGLSRGGQIVRAAQMLAYSAPVAASIGVHLGLRAL